MKKTVSLLLAVLLAAVAVCTFAIGAFAAPDNDDPVDERETTSTTVAETSSTKAEETSSTAKADETTSTTKEDDSTTATVTTTSPDVTKTMAVSQTNYIDPDENSTKATTTKKPAKVDNTIPSTGSSVVVPAVALLALAAGVTAVVKTKKDN